MAVTVGIGGTGLCSMAVTGIVVDVGAKLIAVVGMGVTAVGRTSLVDSHGTMAAKHTNTAPIPKSHNKPLIFSPALLIGITSPYVDLVTYYGIFVLITST
jgi:hypothetical protein